MPVRFHTFSAKLVTILDKLQYILIFFLNLFQKLIVPKLECRIFRVYVSKGFGYLVQKLLMCENAVTYFIRAGAGSLCSLKIFPVGQLVQANCTLNSSHFGLVLQRGRCSLTEGRETIKSDCPRPHWCQQQPTWKQFTHRRACSASMFCCCRGMLGKVIEASCR